MDAAIDVGREIEKHKANRPVSPSPDTNKEQGSDEPRINKNPESGLKTETAPENSPRGIVITDRLTDDLKEALAEMLLEKFLDKTLGDVLSFKSIPIHDVIAWMETHKK